MVEYDGEQFFYHLGDSSLRDTKRGAKEKTRGAFSFFLDLFCVIRWEKVKHKHIINTTQHNTT